MNTQIDFTCSMCKQVHPDSEDCAVVSKSRSDDLLCCPHCKSDEGIDTTYWEQRICLFGWDGAMVESDIPTGGLKFRKTGKCTRCGKFVRIPVYET